MLTLPQLLLLIAVQTGGVIAWGVIAYRRFRRQPVLAAMPDERPRWNPIAVLAVAAWIGLQVFDQIQSEWMLHVGGPVSEPDVARVKLAIFINVLGVAFGCLLLSDMGNRRFREFGIRLDRWTGDLAAGGFGFLAAMPPVTLVLLAVQLVGDPGEERKHSFLRLLEAEPGFATALWIGVAVIIAAPLFEELVYRVILQGALRRKLPAAAAIGISALLFAGVHGFPDSLALLPLAIVLGYVFEKRRSYLAVVVLHALFNASNLAVQLLSETAR